METNQKRLIICTYCLVSSFQNVSHMFRLANSPGCKIFLSKKDTPGYITPVSALAACDSKWLELLRLMIGRKVIQLFWSMWVEQCRSEAFLGKHVVFGPKVGRDWQMTAEWRKQLIIPQETEH